MKGRIIGREGRNIRTIETLTGVDFNIDDTPLRQLLFQVSILSDVKLHVLHLRSLSWTDVFIRHALRKQLKNLQKEVESIAHKRAKVLHLKQVYTVFTLNLSKLFFLVNLNSVTSYGQNVLKHSIEVSHLAGVMAGELSVDVALQNVQVYFARHR